MDRFERRYKNIVEKYRDIGFDVERAFIGCNEDQLIEIADSQNVRLPLSYISLMRVMGQESAHLFDGGVMTYPDVLELRDSALELCRDYGVPFWNLDNALVFMHYGGYQYWYFVCDGIEDPHVWFIQEGSAESISNNQSLSDLVQWYFECRLESFVKSPARLKYIKNLYSSS